MKYILSFIFAFSGLGLVLNCSAVNLNHPNYQREWVLVEFDRFSREQLVVNRAGMNLTGDKMDHQVKGNASMGCNQIIFSADFKNNGKLKLSELKRTKMACLNTDLEDAFIKKFTNMIQYKIEGHRLTLSDKEGKEMKFIAADWD